MKTFLNVGRAFGSFVIAIGLAACASKPTEVDVQKDWAKTFRKLGIVPTFPAREDFMVGDVFLVEYDPNSTEVATIFETDWDKLTPDQQKVRLSLGMDTRTLRLDLNKEIAKEYSQTLSAPATTPDFNSILGNPVLAAASAAVDKLAAELKKLETAEAAAAKKNTDAIDAYTAASHKKAGTDGKLTAAKAKLTTEEAKPVDVKKEADAADAAQKKIWDIDQKIIDAKYEQSQVLADADKKRAADQKIADLGHQREIAAGEQTKANAELASAKAKKPDTTAFKKAVDDLTDEQAKDAEEVLKREQAKSITASDLKAVQDSNKTEIAELTAEKTKAEATKTAIGLAGARLLYPEPTFGNENLFTKVKLPEKDTPASEAARVNRLRLVAFPEFSVVNVKAADLSAFVPIDALGLGLNLSSESISQISVKIPAAESYAISTAVLYDYLFATKTDPFTKKDSIVLSSELKKVAQLAKLRKALTNENNPGKQSFYLRVVTEVFYARAIDISLFSSKSRGGRLSVNSPSKDETGKATEKGFTPAATPDVSSLLAQISGRLSTEQALPGGSIQLIGKSETSIGMRRVFDRPVAIGWRGLVLKVNEDSEEVEVKSDTGQTTQSLDKKVSE